MVLQFWPIKENLGIDFGINYKFYISVSMFLLMPALSSFLLAESEMALPLIFAVQKMSSQKYRLLQHIGKIDRPPELVIFLHICTFDIFQVFSIYPNLASC